MLQYLIMTPSLTMRERLSVEVPLDIQFRVLLRLDIALQMKRLALSQLKLRLQGHDEPRLLEGFIRLGGVVRSLLACQDCVNLFHFLKAAGTHRVDCVQVDVGLACGEEGEGGVRFEVTQSGHGQKCNVNKHLRCQVR